MPTCRRWWLPGVRHLRPQAVGKVRAGRLPANNLIRFSDDFGGETNLYQGFDLNLDARFRNGAFLRGGIGAGNRVFDYCNLQKAGYDAAVTATNVAVAEAINTDKLR